MKPTFYDQHTFPNITNVKDSATVGQRTGNAPECRIIHKYPNSFYFYVAWGSVVVKALLY